MDIHRFVPINAENNYTALRDIHDLIDKKILKRTEEGGRSTNYVLDETNIL